MWGQPPSPALSGAEGAVRRAKAGCISTTLSGQPANSKCRDHARSRLFFAPTHGLNPK